MAFRVQNNAAERPDQIELRQCIRGHYAQLHELYATSRIFDL